MFGITSSSTIAIATVALISGPQGLPDETRPGPLDRVVMTFAVTYHPIP
jgi:hypothetical protein